MGCVKTGSVTISINGAPLLLKSNSLLLLEELCVDFPASSSRCARVILIVLLQFGVLISTLPPETIGSSH